MHFLFFRSNLLVIVSLHTGYNTSILLAIDLHFIEVQCVAFFVTILVI